MVTGCHNHSALATYTASERAMVATLVTPFS
jgi:hypothetical protein